jgi:plasmid stabilization system protein ParE
VVAWYDAHHRAGMARWIRALGSADRQLRAFPMVGRLRDDIAPGYRSYPLHPYILFYQIDEVHRRVIVIALIHSKRDPETITETLPDS